MLLRKRAKRRLIVVGAVLLLVAGGVSAWRVARKAQARRLTEQACVEGMKAYHDGDYATAVARLRYYCGRRAEDLQALLALADARVKLPAPGDRHLVEAIEAYLAALRVEPKNRQALDCLLEVYRTTNQRVEGMAIADRLLALDPDDIEALAIKGAGLVLDRRFGEALAYADRLVQLEPGEIRWRASLLDIRRAQGVGDEELLRLCDSWIGGYDGDGRFHLLKAQTLLSLGRPDAARAEARRAAELGADSLDLLQAVMDLLDRLELDEEAGELLAQAKRRFPGSEWVVHLAVRQLWNAQRFDLALAEMLDAERELGRLTPRLLRWKALLLMEAGRDDEAETTLLSLVALAETQDSNGRAATRAWAEALRARLHYKQSGWLVALEAYRRSLALDRDDPILHFLVAEAYADVGEHELAAALYRRATLMEPQWVAPQLAGARSLLILGRPEEALSALMPLVRQNPRVPLETCIMFARAWLAADPEVTDVGLANDKTGAPVDVVEFLQSLKPSGSAAVTELLVDAHLMKGSREMAVELIEEVLADPAAQPKTLLLLAQASDRADLGLQERLVKRARDLAGLTVEVAEAEARNLHRQGQTEKALALIDDAWADVGQDRAQLSRARLARAAFLVWAGHPQAQAALAGLLDEEPGTVAPALFVMSQPVAWEDAGLISRARDHLKTIVGADSPHVLLAEATYVLQFESRDGARLAEAVFIASKLLRRMPRSLGALTLMSRLLLAGEEPDLDGAIKYLEQAVDHYPGQSDLYPRLITLLQQRGDYDAALQYLRRLGEESQVGPELQWAEVGLLQRQGDFDAALLRLSRIVGESSPEAEQLVLASSYQRVGKNDDAERIYERLLAGPDPSTTLKRVAADFYANTGRFDEALALLRSFGTPADQALLLGQLHENHGYLEDAERLLRQAVQEAPDSIEAWYHLARHFLSIGDYGQARETAHSGLTVDGNSASLRAVLAVADLQLGDGARREAIERFADIGADREALLATITLSDRVAQESGAPQPSTKDCTEARTLVRDHPHFLPAWRLAVTLHVQAGRFDEAAQLALEAVSRFQAEAEPAEWATRTLIQAGRLDEALKVAGRWRERAWTNGIEIDTVIASIQLDLGQPGAAIRILTPHADRIWAEHDRFPNRAMVWLRALLSDGQLDRAAALVQPLIAQDERWRAAWLALATTVTHDVAYEALTRVEPVMLVGPGGTITMAEAWLILANRAEDPSYYTRAEALALEAGRDPGFEIPALLLRGSIGVARRDFATADSLYRTVLEREPDNLVALNNLACTLLQLEDRCEDAVALSGRAVLLSPGDPDVQDTYAQALACVGRLAEAEQAARSAVLGRSSDPRLLLTLARLLVAQSRVGEARETLNQADKLLHAAPGRDRDASMQVEELRRGIDSLQPAGAP